MGTQLHIPEIRFLRAKFEVLKVPYNIIPIYLFSPSVMPISPVLLMDQLHQLLYTSISSFAFFYPLLAFVEAHLPHLNLLLFFHSSLSLQACLRAVVSSSKLGLFSSTSDLSFEYSVLNSM